MGHGEKYWLRNGRTTRRRLLGTLTTLAAGVGGLTLVGCGGDNNSKSTAALAASAASPSSGAQGASAAAQPKRGGSVTLPYTPLGAQPMDPHISLNKAFIYWGLITDRFINPNPLTVSPLEGALVEKWEQPDPQTILLHARQGVKWHEGKTTNGRAFTADDIAFSIMRIGGKLDPSRVALFQRSTLLLGLDKVDTTDPTTAKITLSQPNAGFLYGLADFRQYAVPKEQVDKDPNFQTVSNFSGTGAYVIQSYDDASSAGTYAANKSYWRQGQPYLDKINQVGIADTSTGAAAFVSKQIPVAAMDTNSEKIISSGRSDYKKVSWEYIGWDYFRLNQTRGQLTDARVRKALHLAIDRAQLGDAGYGQGNWDYTGTLPSGLPGTWKADDVKKKAGYNPDAKSADIATGLQLLDAAGFPKGKGVSFTVTPFSAGKLHDDAIRVKDQLSKAYSDIKVDIKEPADAADHAKKLGTGDYDAIVYVSFPAPDAGLEANQHYGLKGGRNYTKYNNPDVEALIQKTFTELDSNARLGIIDQIQQKLYDDIFILTTNKNRPQYAVDNGFRGFEGMHGPGSASGYDLTDLARLWWLA